MKKLFFFLFSLSSIFYVKSQELKFDQFIIEEGLTSINAILIDHFGYKWFGGTHGLYKYDGYEFEAFHHSTSDSSTLSSNDVMVLFEDSNHNIWVGTANNGVNIFERNNESIIRLSGIALLTMSTVTAFEEDQQGNIWVGTLKNGIFIFDTNRNLKKHFAYNILDLSSLSNNDVFDFLLDSQENFWVVTNSGSLDLFESKDSSFVHFQFSDKPLTGVRSGEKLLEIDSTKLWIGTEGDGIFEFDILKKEFKNYKADQPKSISNNIITGLAKDSKDNVWVSTDGGGLNCFYKKSNTFKAYSYDERNEFGLSNNASYSLWVDKSDRVWLGMGDGKVNISSNSPFQFFRATGELSLNVVVDLYLSENNHLWVALGGKGIDIIDLKTKRNIRNVNSKSEPLLMTDIILCVFQDSNSDFWVGTFLGGVIRIDEDGNVLEHYKYVSSKNSLSNDHVFDIVEDKDGNIWFATQGGGVDKYDPTTGSFKNFNSKNSSGLTSDRIQTIFVDQQNRVWIGHFSGGLQLFDNKSQTFDTPLLPKGLSQTLSHYPIHSIYEDSDNRLLVGTGGIGLIIIENDFQTLTIYNVEKGLPSNSVYGMIQQEGKYWVSTNNGIAQIDPVNSVIAVIDKTDGLLTNDFESGSIDVSNTGRLYFGSKEGILSFDPDRINETRNDVNIVFSNLAVFNQPVKPGVVLDDQVVLNESLLYSNQINLPYTQNNFSLSFTAPQYEKPSKLLFRYKLVGLDERWIFARSDRRFVNYSNMDFGHYQLKVQASTDGGKSWGANESIDIIVNPPFYQTKLAYLIYFMILAVSAYIIYIFIKGRILLRNQLNLEKFSREKDNELNSEKINFFTGISHEIRTPLTLILGHIDKISQFENINNKLKQELRIIRKNGNRLLLLINQLLDFRKMESGQMKLKVAKQDVIFNIEEILLPFRELAIQKSIAMKFRNNLLQQFLYVDASKLEIILYNLLSNSLKFTSNGGRIELGAHSEKGNLIISVSDSGMGIAKKNLTRIFDPFFQGNAGSKHRVIGTGIGLSLVKDVVRLHKGEISVESEEGTGTLFRVSLPCQKNYYCQSEIVELVEIDNDIETPNNNIKTEQPIEESPTLKMLIVEDNIDILDFLRDNFKNQYEISTAVNGQEGFEIASDVIPDIIISDVMMPKMDGIELCRHLKKDIRTNHIPIILLTAKTGFIHEHSGLDTGADDYVTKPFKIELLNIRVHNLVENRRLIHSKFRKELLLEPKQIDINDPNEQFISEAMNFVETNISNTEYTVKDLAKNMGLSHSVLYRKVQALTNFSINDFIKSVRLKRAAQLLKSGAYNISDVGYMTGFSNPKYFSTCFKAEFGCSPSEFSKENTDSKSTSIS